MNAWLLLALAIVSELIASTALKAANGFEKLLPSLAVLACYGLSFYFLSQSLTAIPLGIAYAIWSGVGIAATAVIGRLLFSEALTLGRLAGLALVVAGVVALNLAGEGTSGR